MNVDSILNYERDPNEDFYNLLGCDRSSTQEQIIAEFKARAKKCHPDKTQINNPNDPDALNEEKLPGKTDEFQLLHQVRTYSMSLLTIMDPLVVPFSKTHESRDIAE